MDVETIGAALRRKLGPLPVWIWAIFGGMVVYFLRKRGYFGGTGVQQGDALQPSQTNATPPQEQIPLQPGESVYDPNTGALSTAPGGDAGMGGSDNTDVATAIDDLAATIAANQTTTKKTNPTTPRQGGKHNRDPAAGHHKPRSKPGGKRAAKKKPAHKQAGHKTAPRKKTARKTVTRPRTQTTHRQPNGGRTRAKGTERSVGAGHGTAAKSTGIHYLGGTPRPRAAVATPANTVRQRPTVGITRQTGPTQHPVSSHPARSSAPHPVPRPSAPAPRTARTPAPRPAPPRPPRAKPATPARRGRR